MKILIKKNAAEAYVAKCTKFSPVNWSWYDKLKAIEGMELEVETDYLFKDQFNTVPIPGVTGLGLRIMQSDVEKVIDDERMGKGRCNWCGKVVNDGNAEECPHCKKSEYIEKF